MHVLMVSVNYYEKMQYFQLDARILLKCRFHYPVAVAQTSVHFSGAAFGENLDGPCTRAWHTQKGPIQNLTIDFTTTLHKTTTTKTTVNHTIHDAGKTNLPLKMALHTDNR
jgi:hypothetical protein